MDGIQTAVDRIVQQLPVGQGQQKDIKSAFLELLDRVVSNKADTTSSAGSSAVAPTATQLLPGAFAAATGGASSAGAALLKNPSLAGFEQLSNDLTADSSLYNEREVELRDRLDLPELENRLRSSAKSFGVEYPSTDLDGILRNAGYGAAHLGSSDRYMDAIEKFAQQAESTYRKRSGNSPGLA